MHPSATAPRKCTVMPAAHTYGTQLTGIDVDVEFFNDEHGPIDHDPHVHLLQKDGLASRLPPRKDVSFSERDSNHPGEGAMARDLQLLQKDLSDSHRRVLRILEPHVQGATHVEAEIAALREENLRLHEQLKLTQVTDLSLVKQSRGASLKPRVSSRIVEPRYASSISSYIPPDRSDNLGSYSSEKSSEKKRVSLRISEPQIGENIESTTRHSPHSPIQVIEEETTDQQGLRSSASPDRQTQMQKSVRVTGTGSRKPTQYWEIVKMSKVERRVTELQRQCGQEQNMAISESVSTEAMLRHSGWRQRLKMVIESNAFEMVFGFIIVSNAAFIGLEVDYTAGHPTDDVPKAYQGLGYFYTAVFTFELMLRLIADCRGFLWTNLNQMMWNYLDILIVTSSLAEVALDVVKAASAGSDSGGVNLSNLRIIRIIRITKLMRLFRIARIVKFVRALRTLIMSILSTLKAVFWSLLLLTVIIYCFAILFTQASTDYTVEVQVGSRDDSLSDQESWALHYFWGSLAESMLALFMSISGGVSWVEVAQPLRSVDPMWLYMFLMYISFVYFAVLNVVTGVFCQAAIESQQNDQEAMVQAFLSNKRLFTDRFKKLFQSIDSDESGQVTRKEFEDNLKKPKVEAYFATLGIEPSDARGLFRLLEANGDEGLDIEEFVHGCLRLKGPARSADLARLMHEHHALAKEVTALQQSFDSIKEHLHG